MIRLKLRPASTEFMSIEGGEKLSSLLRRSRSMEAEGKISEACEMRLEGVEALLNAIGEEEVRLNWEDKNSRSAMELLYLSAADHLSIGEVETATTLWEQLLALDEEDHLEAVVMLALCYIVLEDWECLEDALFNISTKSPEYHLINLWAEYRRSGGIDKDTLRTLRTRHKLWFEEFVATEHPADEAYLTDCRSERPSQSTEAREFWFATEAIWQNHKDFITSIRKA
ncbi:MAG: tetratricopeptide repeat protein [Alistipes sp.]|nr:tetratricopeptide repeat protein [Alistipes sp.]